MDVLRDKNYYTWYKLASQIVGATNVPQYVRDYTPPDEDAASLMDDSDFADPGKRAYPIDSPGATWLSAAYYINEHPEHCPGAGTKRANVRPWHDIYRAARAWGIAKDVDKMAQTIVSRNGAVKQAAVNNESNYGWIVKDTLGNTTARRYPMFDAEGVTKAATYFDDNRRCYPWDIRQSIARNILKKAAEYGVPEDTIPSSVLREAGKGIPRSSVLMHEINERARMAKDAEAGVLLANVNRLIATSEHEDFARAIDKIAAVLNHFDEVEGLQKYYGKTITYPSDFLAGVSYKEAADFQKNAVKLRRHIFDPRKLAQFVSPDLFGAVVGDEFVKKIVVSDKQAQANGEPGVDPIKLARELNLLPATSKAALEDAILAACV